MVGVAQVWRSSEFVNVGIKAAIVAGHTGLPGTAANRKKEKKVLNKKKKKYKENLKAIAKREEKIFQEYNIKKSIKFH